MSSEKRGATLTECDHCGYTWDYSGRLSHATCPDCQMKTSVGRNES